MSADLDPSATLCPCGIRGCDLAAQHATAFIAPVPMWRRFRTAREKSTPLEAGQ